MSSVRNQTTGSARLIRTWKRLRKLDFWVGAPLAWALGVLSRKSPSLAGTVPTSPPRRVICSQFTGLGNVTLSLPLLRALKEADVKVAFWSFEGQAELVELSGLADEVWGAPARSSFFLWRWIPAVIRARKFKADAFIDLETSSSLSAVLARLSGAPARVGFLGSGGTAREKLYTQLVSVSSVRHQSETLLLPLVSLGLGKPPSRRPSLPSLPDLSDVRTLFPDVRGRKKVIVNVNSNESRWHRHWPDSNWVSFCNQICEDRDVDLYFPGGAADRGRIQNLIAQLKDPVRAHNLAGEPTLAELLKLLTECDLVVTVESGIMHLAAWSGSPVLALFGPQTPEVGGPLGAQVRTIWGKTACSPCYLATIGAPAACRDNTCMRQIDVADVLEASRTLLGAPKITKAKPSVAA